MVLITKYEEDANHIYPAIRQGFWPSRMTFLPFLDNPKDLDPSYKMKLDLWNCFGRKKTLSYNRKNMISEPYTYHNNCFI